MMKVPRSKKETNIGAYCSDRSLLCGLVFIVFSFTLLLFLVFPMNTPVQSVRVQADDRWNPPNRARIPEFDQKTGIADKKPAETIIPRKTIPRKVPGKIRPPGPRNNKQLGHDIVVEPLQLDVASDRRVAALRSAQQCSKWSMLGLPRSGTMWFQDVLSASVLRTCRLYPSAFQCMGAGKMKFRGGDTMSKRSETRTLGVTRGSKHSLLDDNSKERGRQSVDDTCFAVIVRDPRAVAVSEYHFDGELNGYQSTLDESMQKTWSRRIRKTQKVFDKYYFEADNDKYFFMFYEDLFFDFEAQTQRLFKWMNLPLYSSADSQFVAEATNFDNMQALHGDWHMRRGVACGFLDEIGNGTLKEFTEEMLLQMTPFLFDKFDNHCPIDDTNTATA